jgi:hypothetical protein
VADLKNHQQKAYATPLRGFRDVACRQTEGRTDVKNPLGTLLQTLAEIVFISVFTGTRHSKPAEFTPHHDILFR